MKQMRWIGKFFIFGFLLASIFCFSVDSYATNGIQIIGMGPVVRSMGGAGSALPRDSAVV
ncbi:MAG: hydrocarbon degradation protein, partial [Nitrospinae bacterium]|nr:hydrocarbon degradation protein [Nitrospinota bacterium]